MSDQGHTLTEVVVAVALLVTVLAPAGAFLGRIALQSPVRQQAEAEALAEAQMSRLLIDPTRARERTREDGKWLVDVQQDRIGDLVRLRCLVRRAGTQVQAERVRLVYLPAESVEGERAQ